MENAQHYLAAILSGDVVGYSRLMADNEIETVHTLNACRRCLEQTIVAHNGRLVDFTGDNFLAEFRSATQALRGAWELQSEIDLENAKLPDERRMRFRLGLHLGEVLSQEGRLYGDGVNIAARLEGIAEPGGVCISGDVFQQVSSRSELSFTDLGPQTLKNIPKPVQAYRVIADDASREPALVKVARKKLQPPSKPSIAVLPFVNLGGDSGQDYFADGLMMDITNKLVKIPDLFVVSEFSTLTYRGQFATASLLGRELGVNHVLEGGVQTSPDRIRVHAQLIETTGGRRVWAERYERPRGDLFAIQDDITGHIVTALDVKLVSGEQGRLFRSEFRKPEAVEACYQGWHALFRNDPGDVELAEQYFERASEIDPESSAGFACTAWACWWAGSQRISAEPEQAFERAEKWANQAIEIGDTTGLSHIVLAHLHLIRGEHGQANEEADRATRQRPSCDAAFAAKANVLRYLGHANEAIQTAHHAMRITPLQALVFPAVLASAYHGAGQYEDAIEAAQSVLANDPVHVDTLIILAASLAALDRLAEARQVVTRIVAVEPAFSVAEFVAHQPFADRANGVELASQLATAGLS
jgi:adenylate cyclase